MNGISIPVGYWSVPTNVSVSPFIPGAWSYIQRAVGWARTHGLHTIIDLHGAPGSQNGYDNSGRRTGSPQWALNATDVNATLAVIQVLASELGPNVDAIELLNEVAGFYGSAWDSAVRQYYQSGYAVVRQTAGNDIVVVIGDAFEGVDVRAFFFVKSFGRERYALTYFSGAELGRILSKSAEQQRDDGLRTSILPFFGSPHALFFLSL